MISYCQHNVNRSNRCHFEATLFKSFVSFLFNLLELEGSKARRDGAPKHRRYLEPQINRWWKATKNNCVRPLHDTEIFLFY